MIIPDLNILLYAVDSSSERHGIAKDWLESTVNSKKETIGLPWVVHLGFLRLISNPRVFPRPLSIEAATDWLETFESNHNVQMLNPKQAHSGILRHLLLLTGTGGNLVTDAHLAALAIENNARLVTGDRDFSRFPGLKIVTLF